MCADRSATAAGFTLLEVVVALAIAALALVGLFEAGSGGLFAADTAARAEEAVQRAQSHLAAIGKDAALVAGESAGDDGGGYRWRLRLEPMAQRSIELAGNTSPTILTLFDVEVAILWHARGRDRAVVLKTRRLSAASAGG